MIEKQVSIVLRSEDPHGYEVTLDDLRGLLAEAEALAHIVTIELRDGEIVVVGEQPPMAPPVTPTVRLTVPSPRVSQ